MHPELVRATRLRVDTEIASLHSNTPGDGKQCTSRAATLTRRAITPAIRALERARVPFDILRYDHDPAATSYGLEAVELLHLPPSSVFKTLVVTTDAGRPAVALVPAHRSLDLKAMADALGARRAAMALPADAERATGYVLGGISPLGQKRRLPTVIDASALELPVIHVSAGRRGLEIALAPTDLVRLCDARTAVIARER